MTFFCRRSDVLIKELAHDLDLTMKLKGKVVCLYTKRGGQFVDSMYRDPVDMITIPNELCFAHVVARARSLPYLMEYHNPTPEHEPRIH